MNDSTQQSCGVQRGGAWRGGGGGALNALAGQSLWAAPKPETEPEPESKRIESNRLSCHFEQGRGRRGVYSRGAVGVDTYALLHLNYVKSILF